MQKLAKSYLNSNHLATGGKLCVKLPFFDGNYLKSVKKTGQHMAHQGIISQRVKKIPSLIM